MGLCWGRFQMYLEEKELNDKLREQARIDEVINRYFLQKSENDPHPYQPDIENESTYDPSHYFLR